MKEFEYLKNSYITTIHWGFAANVGYHESKRGNDIIHKFCENLIDNSNYNDADKNAMKQELELLKETLSAEIESYYLCR